MTATLAPAETQTYVPQHKQAIMHTCPADRRLFGGAAGGGKSEGGLNEFVSECQSNPGIRLLILRREVREFEQLVQRAMNIISRYPGMAIWVAGKRWFQFANGSLLGFGHAANELDIEKYAGDEWDGVLLEEEPTFTPYQRQFIPSRIRSARGYWARVTGTCNPMGVSFMQVKNEFVTPPDRNVELLYWFDEPAAKAALALDENAVYDYAQFWRAYPEGERGNPAEIIGMDEDGVVRGLIIVWRPEPNELLHYINRERAKTGLSPMTMPTRCFIPSLLQDNKYYWDDGQYAVSLAANVGKTLAEQLLKGSWKHFEGQAFPEFSEVRHVIPAIVPGEGWTVWGGYDWGWDKPGCHLWLTKDPKTQQVIVYREAYHDHTDDADWCRLIQEMTGRGEKLRYSWADPSIFDNEDEKQKVLSKIGIYRRHGVVMERANNRRVTGWGRVRELLAINPQTGESGVVFTSNCVNLIRTLPALVLDKFKPEDVDSDGEDHAADALRYALMAGATNQRRYTKKVVAGRVRR